MTDDGGNDRAFLRALGDELRRARQRNGWTRKDLEARLAVDVSLQTLATYELGTRQCSVVRLLNLVDALDVSVFDVLAQAVARVRMGEKAAGWLDVDLIKIIRDDSAELSPLHRWARSRVSHTPPGSPTRVRLYMPALATWAEVSGLSAKGLIRGLYRLAERPSV